MIAAVDPGRNKCGIAVAAPDGAALLVKTVAAAEFEKNLTSCCKQFKVTVIVCGNGTGKEAAEFLKTFDIPLVMIDETNSTIEARALYYKDNPPGCLWSLLPSGLLYPPEPVDGYAALVLARRYIDKKRDSI